MPKILLNMTSRQEKRKGFVRRFKFVILIFQLQGIYMKYVVKQILKMSGAFVSS
ncbi:unnamed protein product [Paramecium pentaurelia]|uniref:Uncharacterized protein n=1 Tax=Paramecium pentaurelia TaxID=43138 RepID=A0A8S1YQG4_9CILI|nr:unnamed protein product [Paramecium pentaurelia]